MDVVITGANDLGALAKRLKEAGDKDLRREMFRAIQRSTKPLKAQAKGPAGAGRLPKRGGLAARVAATKLSTRTRTGPDPGVRILAMPNAVKDPKRIDRGAVRHPVFGRGSVIQNVPAGWFSGPMAAGAPEVRRELEQSIGDINRKIAH